MQAHMKTRPIKDVARMIFWNQHVVMPIYVIASAEAFRHDAAMHHEDESLSVEEVFGDIINKYTEAGALLRGLRYREDLTQREFAAILNITQANLSAMENGKRNIGKELAKRIANKFKLDYRIFL